MIGQNVRVQFPSKVSGDAVREWATGSGCHPDSKLCCATERLHCPDSFCQSTFVPQGWAKCARLPADCFQSDSNSAKIVARRCDQQPKCALAIEIRVSCAGGEGYAAQGFESLISVNPEEIFAQVVRELVEALKKASP